MYGSEKVKHENRLLGVVARTNTLVTWHIVKTSICRVETLL